jgi:hypothetical protein
MAVVGDAGSGDEGGSGSSLISGKMRRVGDGLPGASRLEDEDVVVTVRWDEWRESEEAGMP